MRSEVQSLPTWVAQLAVEFDHLLDKPRFRRSVREAVQRWSRKHRKMIRERRKWQAARQAYVAAIAEKAERRTFASNSRMGAEFAWDHYLTIRQSSPDDDLVDRFCAWRGIELRKQCKFDEQRKRIAIQPFIDSAGMKSHSFGAWVPVALHSENEPRLPAIFPLPTVHRGRKLSTDEKLVALLAIREIGVRGAKSRSNADVGGPLTGMAFFVLTQDASDLAESDAPTLQSWLAEFAKPPMGRPKGTRKYSERKSKQIFDYKQRNRNARWKDVERDTGVEASLAKKMHDSYRKSEDARIASRGTT